MNYCWALDFVIFEKSDILSDIAQRCTCFCAVWSGLEALYIGLYTVDQKPHHLECLLSLCHLQNYSLLSSMHNIITVNIKFLHVHPPTHIYWHKIMPWVSFHNKECYLFFMQPFPNKPAQFKYKFSSEQTRDLAEGIIKKKNREMDGEKGGKRRGIVTTTALKCHQCDWLWRWSCKPPLWLRRRWCGMSESILSI